MGTAGCWHARRVKAGAPRRHDGVSGPAVHCACPRGGGRGPRAGESAHARQPAGCTVVPQGLSFGGAPTRGGGRASWLGSLGGLGGGGGERGPDGKRLTSRWRGVGRHAAQGELASRQGGVERRVAEGLTSWRGVEDDPVHGPGKSSIGRSHPNRCRKYIYRNVQVGCHHSLHTHGQIYMSDNMMWWMDIYIYTCRTGDISCWVDDMRGLSGPGCLHRASSILGARVHHPPGRPESLAYWTRDQRRGGVDLEPAS